MNDRERFNAALSHKQVDRFFRREMGFWPSTKKRWKKEGLPDDWQSTNFFAFDKEVNLACFDIDWEKRSWRSIDLGYVHSPFYPPFEKAVLEENTTTRQIQDRNGGIRIELKNNPDKSMPFWVRHPVENRKDWKAVKWRLQPDSEGRLNDLGIIAKKIEKDKDREYPLEQRIVGGFMHLRNLFGLEKLCVTMFDDPELIDDILDNWLDVMKYVLARILEVIDLDAVFIGEDICYKKGLLISPKMYQRFLTPPAMRNLLDS